MRGTWPSNETIIGTAKGGGGAVLLHLPKNANTLANNVEKREFRPLATAHTQPVKKGRASCRELIMW